MTNLQLCLTIGIPSVLVILGWLHQNTRLNDLRGDVRDVRGEVRDVRASVDKLSDDYRNFYGMEQKLEGRVEELSRRVS